MQESEADGRSEGVLVLPSRMTLGESRSTNSKKKLFVDQQSGSSNNTTHKLPVPMVQRLKGFDSNLLLFFDEIKGRLNNLDRKVRNLQRDVVKLKEMYRQAGVPERIAIGEGNL